MHCPSLVENFSYFRLLLWNCCHRIQQNLTGSKISTSSTKFTGMFLRLTVKPRWLPRPRIDEDIFDFSSETTKQNSKKLYKKPNLSILYQVCVFGAHRKTKMAALADPSTKVAHCTQVHNMWPFRPLVLWCQRSTVTWCQIRIILSVVRLNLSIRLSIYPSFSPSICYMYTLLLLVPHVFFEYLVIIFVFFFRQDPTSTSANSKSSFEDKRCRCVCPTLASDNQTFGKRTVTIRDDLDPNYW